MKNFLFPYFNTSQRRGIMLLLFLIVVLQLSYIFYDNLFPVSQQQSYQIPKGFEKQYDSLKAIVIQKKQKKIYPFNPNYLTDFKGYFLGMTTEEIDRVLNYRKQGKYFQTKLEFKKVSGISDSLYEVLKNYINIPFYKKNNSVKIQNTTYKTSTTNINEARAEDLKQISGIGEVLSKRIVKYRKSIGGFTEKSQINKVYGLKPEVIQKIWQVFYLPSSNKAIPKEKKSINTTTIDELHKLTGIHIKLAERIINYRNKLGGFIISEQLAEVYGLSDQNYQRIWEYYEIKNSPKNVLKINLNNANIKELSKNPYISYQLSKKIVSYRTLHGAFHNFEDLLKVEGFPNEKLKLISLYLKIE